MRLPLVALLFAVPACAPLRYAAISAGHVGCPESEISTSDEEEWLEQYNWTAKCRGVTYYCVKQRGALTHEEDVTCTEAVPLEKTEKPAVVVGDPGPPKSQHTGCANDMDCKGRRICVEGACAEPAGSEGALNPQ